MRTLEDRFWEKVDRSGSCWLWTGQVDGQGYGRFFISGHGQLGAHRVAYELMAGPIPEGLHIDHLCRVRHCVNPAHLEPVTPRQNALRGEGAAATNAAKTHCPQGHPYDEANTYTGLGRRACRACNRVNSARYRATQIASSPDEGTPTAGRVGGRLTTGGQ